MARNTFEAWIPEEFGSNIIQRVQQVSAIERFAQRIPMGTETRSTPRSGGMNVSLTAKGGTYNEDSSTNDAVTLACQKFTGAVRIAEEDINDSLADIINAKMVDWATSYAKGLDNACLGVSVAKGTSLCAFDSVYYLLTQANSATSYTANANLHKTTSGTPVAYDDFSFVLGLVESGDYWDDGTAIVIAHPSYKAKLRSVKDDSGRPIFQESSGGFPGGGTAPSPDMLFGKPVHWTLGARTNTTFSSNPTGNPLLFVASSEYLMLGVRSGPESVFIDGRDGLSALTDESILKMRARRAFALGNEHAVACLEDVNGV